MDKITLIEGDWLSDTDQRTECLQKAKKDGIDFLMVHDADEFYFHQDFEKIKDIVFNEPTYEVFDMNLYAFWRAFKYRIINHDQSPISGCNQTVVNLHRVNKYDHIRDVHTSNRMVIPEVICYHGSYVLTDEEAWKKINMTSHSNDYDGVKWYNEVWLPWTLDSRNLHPIWPWAWSHCEIYEGELPEPIKDFDKVHML